MGNWFESLFDEIYLDFYPEVLASTNRAANEAAFMDRALGLNAGSRVLDVGCGLGRHSVPLALLGHRVTGVDLSETMLRVGQELARNQGVDVSWLRRDMRDLSGLGPFDACVCLYTVFGYFDDSANLEVLRQIHDVLGPGGQLVLDVTNALALMRRWQPTSWRDVPTGVAKETARYDPLTAMLTSERTLYRSEGPSIQLDTSVVRMYAPHELASMLRQAGLEPDLLYGGLDGSAFEWHSSRSQVWVARKP